MNVTHEVGAVWRIIDQGTPTLRLIGDALNTLDVISKRVEDRLARIGTFKLTGLIEEFGKVGGAAEAAQLKIQGLSDTRFAGINRGLTGISSRLEGIERRAGSAGRALGSMPALPGSGGGGRHVRPEPSNTGGHGRHREGAGVDIGIFGFIGAEAVGHGVGDILKHGAELQHVQEQMLQGGMKSTEVAEATAKAWEEASKYGLSVAKVMDDIKELRFPFGSTEHAVQFIDPLERMRVVLNSVSDGKGNESADAVYKMARAGELKGLQDPQDYLSYFDQMTKVISATGGKVGPNDFMQATKYGKMASFGWDEDFYTRYLPTMIQTMGASTAGQSLMSLTGTLVSGSVTKRSLGRMQELGLIGDESKIVYDNFGQPKGFHPGAIKGTDEFVKNPFAWAKDVLTPLLEKQYGDLADPANKEKAIENLTGIFGNRNSAASIAELSLRSKSFDKDAGLTGTASGIAGADRLLNQDPNASLSKLQAAWSNFMISLGKPAVQKAIDSMNLISGGINKLSEFAERNPEAVKSIVGALAGLATGLGALALVGLAIFLPQGLFVVAMTTLGGALGGIIAMNWDKITQDFQKIEDFFKSIGQWFSDKFSGAPAWHRGMPQGYHPTAFDGANDNDNPLTQSIRQGFVLAFQDIQGGNFSANGAAGGGLINAAYTTYGSGGGGLFGGGGTFSGSIGDGSAVDRALGLRGAGQGQAAQALGHIMHAGEWCADFVNGIIKQSGGQGSGSAMARSFMGWGHAVGLGSVMKGDVAVLNGGGHVGFFTGERLPDGRLGIVAGNTRDGRGGHDVEHYFVNPGSVYGARRALSVGAPPPQSRAPIVIHNHTVLDGKIVASNTTRVQAHRGRFPTSVGSLDAHGSFASPGTPFIDAA